MGLLQLRPRERGYASAGGVWRAIEVGLSIGHRVERGARISERDDDVVIGPIVEPPDGAEMSYFCGPVRQFRDLAREMVERVHRLAHRAQLIQRAGLLAERAQDEREAAIRDDACLLIARALDRVAQTRDQ